MRKTIRERLDAYGIQREDTECIEWSKGTDRCGYGLVKYNGKMRSVHRVSYEVYIGPIPDGLHVRHSCDNPRCYNPKHLLLGTHKDNMRDKADRGRVKGLHHPRCVMTPEMIRDVSTSDEPVSVLMERHKVSRSTIYRIKQKAFDTEIIL